MTAPACDHVAESFDIIERISELEDAWRETTGDDPDDYALSEDDWSVGLGADDAREIVALLEIRDRVVRWVRDGN